MKTIYRRLLSRFQLKLKQVKSYLSQDVGQMDAFYIELIYFIFDSEKLSSLLFHNHIDCFHNSYGVSFAAV